MITQNNESILGIKAKIDKIQDEQAKLKKEINRISVLINSNNGILYQLQSDLFQQEGKVN